MTTCALCIWLYKCLCVKGIYCIVLPGMEYVLNKQYLSLTFKATWVFREYIKIVFLSVMAMLQVSSFQGGSPAGGFCDVCPRHPCSPPPHYPPPPPHCQCLSLVHIISHLETPIEMEVEVISTWVSSTSLPQKDFTFILKAFHQPPGRAQILSGEFPDSCGAKMGNWEEGGRPGGPRVGGTRFSVREAAPWSKKYLHRALLSSKCYSKNCEFKDKQDTEFLLSNYSHLRHVDCWRGKMATMCCYVL